MMKKISMILIGLLAVGIDSCAKKEEPLPDKISTVSGAQVEILQNAPQEELYESVGTVRSKTTSVLSPRIMGYIVAVHVREGDQVQPGQLLVAVDDRDAAAQLRKAQAGLREAQEMLAEVEQNIKAAESAKASAEANRTLATSTFHRYQVLWERRSVSPQEFEEVQARYQARTAEAARAGEMVQALLARKEQVLSKVEQARAEVDNARLSVSYGRIFSPLAGVVTTKQAEMGAMAAPGVPLLTIEDDRHYRLEATVEEIQISKIHLGSPVRVRIDALGQMEWPCRVAEIVPAADPASRTSVVKIDLPEMGKQAGRKILRSGLFGKARFPVGQRKAITIPQKAILRRGQLQEVYVVDSSDIARLRLIKTGKVYGERAEVLAGVHEGERVIVEGMEKVREGMRVQ